MHPAVGGLLAAGAFAGVLLLGGKALGVWDSLPPTAAAVAQSPLPQTARFKAPKPAQVSTAKLTGGRKKDRRAPRERLLGSDMATARQALLRPSDMRGRWKSVRASSEQGSCRTSTANLSRFTVTGKARSALRGGESFIESRVKLFANAGQADLFFAATFDRGFLRCIRDGVKRSLTQSRLHPRVLDARYGKGPPVGAQTAVFVIDYVITSGGKRFEYPVDVIAFQTGRAVASVSFALVPSDDGNRPCACELYEARLIEGRLRGA